MGTARCAAEALLRGQVRGRAGLAQEQERPQINRLTHHLKESENVEQTKSTASRRKEIINLRQKINCCCSVTESCPTLSDPLDCGTSGFPVPHHLPEPAQTHVYRVSGAIQPSHPLLSPSPPAFNLSQHQGLFQ